MLLQSHSDEITLLPALPSAWPEGSVSGLRARGGFELVLDWKGGKLTGASLRSLIGGACKIRYEDRTIDLATKKGRTYVLNEQLRIAK